MAKGGSYTNSILLKENVKYIMTSPAIILNNLVKHSNISDYKFERLYRILFNEQMFYQAYQRIASKKGNMTPGTYGKTVDGMSIERIERLIACLRDETYKPHPAKRVYIPKKNGKKRPLGIPSFEDKLVQEVVRMILEAIYEGYFDSSSHGFRPRRSCQTALTSIQNTFLGTKWFIEGDIKGFFDNIDHNVLIETLRERINDERFLRLIRKFLNAGYIEDWKFNNTYSGTPQGGIISPILANIYLDKFDKYIAEYIQRFDKGNTRPKNRQYRIYSDRKRRLLAKFNAETDASKREEMAVRLKEYSRLMFEYPSVDEMSPTYRRMKYIRYADDFIIGVCGSKAECDVIKKDIAKFMEEKLKLELSDEKTLITNAKDRAAFLGYEITIRQSQSTKRDKNGKLKRMFNGKVVLLLPRDVVRKRLQSYNAITVIQVNGKEDWKPKSRGAMTNCNPEDILAKVNSEIRGFYNYYAVAQNISTLGKRFGYVMSYSFYCTLAQKLNISTPKVIKKYREGKDCVVRYTDAKGRERCRILYNEGFKKKEPTTDAKCDNLPNPFVISTLSLIERLRAEVCELCGAKGKTVMHHVRTLKTLTENTEWEKAMLQMHRKSLAVCPNCYAHIHDN